MVSDFKIKKLLHLFTAFFDANSSGAIDKSDFNTTLEHLRNLRGWSTDDAKYKETADYLDRMWNGLQNRADPDNDGEVTKEEWISMWDEFGKHPSSGADWQNLFCRFAFALEDSGNDGAVDCEEYSNLFTAFGLDKEETVQAFQKMSGGKSSVSWDEFQELFNEYFATEDVEAPGNYIFGKISF